MEPGSGDDAEPGQAPASAGAPEGTERRRGRGDEGRGRRRRRGRNGAPASVGGSPAAPNGPRAEPAQTASVEEEPGSSLQKNSRRRRRRGRRQRGEPVAAPKREVAAQGKAKRPPARVSRSVPITEVVREGDEVVVQISKEPIGTKGARVTSHVSLAGRYVVYLPTVEHVGISKRIGSSRERSRLRQTIDALKPPTGGLIVRTVAEGLTKKQLKADVGYLIKVWAQVGQRRQGAKSPTILYEELDLVLKAARDLFTDEIDHIVIDDREQYGRLVRFVEMFMPARVKDIRLYTGDEPIFDEYGIEDEIKRALGRKVPLPSGGSLIVDQAEALTAIDVNTGRYVGKGSKDLEETALKTNLEAVDEIAYQLRFRNIGGLVILDLIDMDRAENRDKVWRALEQRLAKDKAKTTINRISELGLIEMTRKRTRESLGRIMHEPCFYCDGTGHIQSRETVAHEILRQIRRDRMSLSGYSVRVHAHPAVVDFLKLDAQQALQEAERRYLRRIELVPRSEYHLEQYDLQGR
jgi:ribonuclease G